MYRSQTAWRNTLTALSYPCLSFTAIISLVRHSNLCLSPWHVGQPHTCPAGFWAWLGNFLLSVFVQCLLRNQACVGSRVLFRRAMHVLKVSLSTLRLPAKMANAWAEFRSKQAVLKDFFSIYQPARYVTCYWDVVLLQKFYRKREKASGKTGDDLSHLRSQIRLSLLWRD